MNKDEIFGFLLPDRRADGSIENKVDPEKLAVYLEGLEKKMPPSLITRIQLLEGNLEAERQAREALERKVEGLRGKPARSESQSYSMRDGGGGGTDSIG